MLHVPGATASLFSVSMVNDNGASVHFEKQSSGSTACVINKAGKVLVKVPRVKGQLVDLALLCIVAVLLNVGSLSLCMTK